MYANVHVLEFSETDGDVFTLPLLLGIADAISGIWWNETTQPHCG